MRQIELVRMHNKFIFLSLITVIFIFFSLNFLCPYGEFTILLGALFIILIPPIVEKIMKVNPIHMQGLLLTCGNLSIFYLNISFTSYIYLIFFIFYLLLISIYQSQKVNIILSIVTLFEIIALSYTYNFFKDPFINSTFGSTP